MKARGCKLFLRSDLRAAAVRPWRRALPALAWRGVLGAILLPAALPAAELANGALPPAAAANGDAGTTVVYDARYFERYEVFTAVDMLRRIPGVGGMLSAAASSQSQRGFGSGGDQILINGRRIAGKANDIVPALERVQAPQVERVELIRGASPDVDVRSDGVIVNVRLREGVDTGALIAWSLGASYLYDTRLQPVGSLTYGNNAGALTYLLAAELTQAQLRRQLRNHRVYDGDGVHRENFHERRYDSDQRLTLTGNALYPFGAGRELRLNALVQQRDDSVREPRDRYSVSEGEEAFLFTRSLLEEQDRRAWEIGGDYLHPLGEDARLSVLFVHTSEDRDVEQMQRRIDSETDLLISHDRSDMRTVETIVRPAVRWNLARGHGVELGVERAFNSLDTDFRLFEEHGGAVVERDVFNSESVVEEIRWEVFTTHSWTLSPQWRLESALNAEFSRIDQQGGDVSAARSFSFWKPRVELRYDVTSSDQLRLRAERTVGQLSFGHFVASYDVEADRVVAGNPDLVPESTWELQLSGERRLANDRGVLSARWYYQRISDYIDTVALTQGSSAQGNLEGARAMGAQVELSLRLAWLGLPDVVANASYLRERSGVDDPMIGQRRVLTNRAPYSWQLDFRHDLAQPSLSWGMELRREGPRQRHEFSWYRHFNSRPELTAFVETRLSDRTTLLIEGEMLIWDRGLREQRFFSTHRGVGDLLRSESMHRRNTPQVGMSLRGTL